MNMFDVLFARSMNSAPLPPNAHLATAITSQPVTDASDYPLPKCDVTVTDADKCEVIVTDDGIITEDNEPYDYRQSAGGDTELDELIGGTVAWNQLVENGNFSNGRTGWVAQDATLTDDGVLTATAQNGFIYTSVPIVNRHAYLAFLDLKLTTATNLVRINPTSMGNWTIYTESTTVRQQISGIKKATESATIALRVADTRSANWDDIKIYGVMFIDITLIVGSTIADYIYSLEQSTAGAGVAWLKEHFPKLFDDGYKAYNTGELVSVKATAHVMRDSNENIIGSYPLSPVELRGLFKLDATNKLYCGGDSYRCDGRVKRRYGIVDLGQTPNSVIYNAGYACWVADITNFGLAKFLGNTIIPNVFDNKGFTPTYFYASKSDNKITVSNSGYLLVGNNSDSIKPDNIIVYELATPTEEYTNPFEKNQAVDAGGTEEYIDDRSVSVPVGHSTKYFNGKAYTKYFDTKSGVVEMADEGIMPMTPMYIEANGTIDAKYWK